MLNSYLYTVVPKGSNWLPRIAFDTAYFVWVGIILFTTITALLVDALSKARTEAALRDSEVVIVLQAVVVVVAVKVVVAVVKTCAPLFRGVTTSSQAAALSHSPLLHYN
jgi:hypothetical protein